MRTRSLASAGAALVALAAAGPVWAAAGFAERMGPVERVITDYSGGSAFDARVRQAAACYVMADSVELLMGGPYYRGEWQGAEQQRRQSYALCVGNRMPDAGMSRAERGRFVTALGEQRRDPRFMEEVRRRYVGTQDLPRLLKLQADKDAAANVSRAAFVERSAVEDRERRDQEERRAGFKQTLLKLLGASVLAVLLGGIGVLRGLRPVQLDGQARPATLAVGGRKYELYDTGGVVADLNRERQTTSYPGTRTYDQHGNLIGSSSGYDVSTLNETIFIIDSKGQERALQFRNWNIVARPGNAVATIWAIERGQSSGPFIAFRNVTLDTSLTANAVIDRMFRISAFAVALVVLGLIPVVAGLTLAVMGLEAMFVAPVAGITAAVVAGLMIRGAARARVRAFVKDQLPQLLDRATKDAHAAGDRVLEPYRPA